MKIRHIRHAGWLLVAILAVSFAIFAQDEGFEVLYEGVTDSGSQADDDASSFDLALYGVSGFSGSGAFWATVGARAAFAVGGFALHGDAGYGTDGLEILAGAETEIAGFGMAGDVAWRPNAQTITDLRAWGSLGEFRVTGNVRLGAGAPSFTFTGSTSFGDLGVSANLGMAGGVLAQASVGANIALGGFTLSGSAGIMAGQFNVGAGAGIALGPFSVVANAGYDARVGLNAIVSSALRWDLFELHVTGLYDNTGIGAEASVTLSVGAMNVSITGRLAGADLNLEVAGGLSFGTVNATVSVAFSSQTGFSWAEVGFELPL